MFWYADNEVEVETTWVYVITVLHDIYGAKQ